MVVLGDVACPTGVAAPVCVRVRIENHGDLGAGSCRLRGEGTDGNAILGMAFDVRALGSGQQIVDVVPWSGQVATNTLTGDCTPGLQL